MNFTCLVAFRDPLKDRRDSRARLGRIQSRVRRARGTNDGMGMLMIDRYGFLLATALVATLAAGCATNGTSSASNDDDKVIVTGSRIPVKDSVHGSVQATSDKNTINDMRRPAAAGGVVGTGGR